MVGGRARPSPLATRGVTWMNEAKSLALPAAADLAGWRRLLAQATGFDDRQALVRAWASALHAADVDGALHLPPDVDHDAASALWVHAIMNAVPLGRPR